MKESAAKGAMGPKETIAGLLGKTIEEFDKDMDEGREMIEAARGEKGNGEIETNFVPGERDGTGHPICPDCPGRGIANLSSDPSRWECMRCGCRFETETLDEWGKKKMMGHIDLLREREVSPDNEKGTCKRCNGENVIRVTMPNKTVITIVCPTCKGRKR